MAKPQNLSLALKKELDRLKSPLKLSTTIYGDWPEKYAFRKSIKAGKDFRLVLADAHNAYAVQFLFINYKGEYDYCYGRALFNRVEDAAIAIDYWVFKNVNISGLQSKFKEIEIFEPFNYCHKDAEKEEQWIRAQNRFFNRGDFWLYPEWSLRYNEMLLAAKQAKEFENLYPFMSMWWLRFSHGKNLNGLWPLDLYIVPTSPGNEYGFIVGFLIKGEDDNYK